MVHPLRERAAVALKDPVLQRALPIATRRAVDKQAVAFDDLGPGVADVLRDRAKVVKDHTTLHLDHYLELFEARAKANGIVVHWAATRDEARGIIDGLLETHGVRRVVKAKSMTTEELELTQHLVGRGVETWETDLGEYIVQLSGKPPSHITAPAIHEDTESISALFHRTLGTPETDDAEALVGYAREVLRPAFLAADCGISGANFLVAESGRLVLVENEANIRLCTTLPKLHIAVVGIEKLVPSEADVPVFLKLLARSATGQRLTTYTHSIRGPRRDDETEGPDEVHVVLLDAGRSAMLADEVARPTLGCIRCGACLNVCPVYQAVGGHTYGGVYPGPIGAVTLPWLEPSKDSRMLPYASTLCGACQSVCPVRIPIPELLLHLRAKRVSDGAASFFEKGMVLGWKASVSGGRLMGFSNHVGRWVLLPGSHDGDVSRLPPPLSGWTKHRDFPLPAKRSFRKRWRDDDGA